MMNVWHIHGEESDCSDINFQHRKQLSDYRKTQTIGNEWNTGSTKTRFSCIYDPRCLLDLLQ